MAKYFLHPRLCPEINVSKSDLEYAIQRYGMKEVTDALHSIITTNYNFPLSKYINREFPRDYARLSCPEMKKSQFSTVRSPQESTIASLRVTRKPIDEIAYPGITVALTDKFAYDDHIVSDLIEPHLLYTWFGASKLHTSSPQERYKDKEQYERLILKSSSLNTWSLRQNLLLSSELTTPNVELYNYIFTKLQPKVINLFETGFGTSIMSLLRFSADNTFNCYYNTSLNSTNMIESIDRMIKTFQKGSSTFIHSSRSKRSNFDLVIGEIFPFETYHIKELHAVSEDYHDYMNEFVFSNITKQIENLNDGSRFVLVVSLRESKKHPTVEPLILHILGKIPKLTFAGNLVSNKKDFIVLLYIVKERDEPTLQVWKTLYERIYPELNFKQEKPLVLEEPKILPVPLKCEGVKQAPREIITFPSKFRECQASTTSLSDGGIMYHFSAVNKFEEEDVSSRFDQGIGNKVKYSMKVKKEKKKSVILPQSEESVGFENDDSQKVAIITKVADGEVITKECECHTITPTSNHPPQIDENVEKEKIKDDKVSEGSESTDFEDLQEELEVAPEIPQKKTSASLFASIFRRSQVSNEESSDED